MPMLTSLPDTTQNQMSDMYGYRGQLAEGEKFLGQGNNWKQFFPQEWQQYLTQGEDEVNRNGAYWRNYALGSIHRGLNPDMWGGSEVADTYNQNNNPWEQTWNRWVVDGQQDPEELAQLLYKISGGAIKTDGETLSKLAEARNSNYKGVLPDTVKGLEGFYNKDSVLADRNRIFQAGLKKKENAKVYLDYLKNKNQPNTMMTNGMAQPPAPFMGKAPTVGDTSNWKAQSMFSA